MDVLKEGKIVLSTQVAFPEQSTSMVYASSRYKGKEDTPNESDGVFRNSLTRNMADSIIGNLQDGFTLSKVITVG